VSGVQKIQVEPERSGRSSERSGERDYRKWSWALASPAMVH